MKWPCIHRFEWDKLYKVTMRHRYTIGGVVVGEPTEYIETRQHGRCKKCGFVKERKI